jgi:serine/threonine-protein kinase
MRQHIEVLLAHGENSTSFLKRPAMDLSNGESAIFEPVGALIGFRVGVYEVRELIGCGGMGEVYRAHDTVLARDIALKVLPHRLTLDSTRLVRFKREAQVLASLNHPHIAAIYGFEEAIARPHANGVDQPGPSRLVRGLVLELVEGETLADRIAQGALPVDQAISIAHQIAGALATAHARGIVHRDLKPANVKVRPDQTVKVLDFGLAKTLDPEDAPPSDTESLAPSTPAITEAGVVLGTAGYMSPEQARGKPADKRSDVWAFGCVLYEMLSGIRPFRGEDVTDTLAAVLRSEPDWSALPATVSPLVVALIRGCLQKDPAHRVGDMTTARFIFEHATEVQAASPPARWSLHRAALIVISAVLAALAVGFLVWKFADGPAPSRALARFIIALPAGDRFSNTGVHSVAISPDGSRLVYTANQRLYLRGIDQLEPVPIRGTEGVGAAAGRSPFFSPDGQWIGFWQRGELKKVSVTGGVAIVLCGAQNPWGASWSTDNSILFGQDEEGLGPGVFRVLGGGGKPQQILRMDRGQIAANPQLLPGGHDVLFTLVHRGDWETAQIAVQRIDTGERHIVLDRGADARYVSTGHLLYTLNGTLLAVPFDATILAVTGTPVPLVENVATQNVTSHFDISKPGSLVYIPGDDKGGGLPPRTLVWIDRQGREEPVNAPPRYYLYPRLSPDGTRVAVEIRAQEDDIWLWDLARETLTRLTFGPSSEQYAVWTPDGRSLVFGKSSVAGARAPRSFFRQASDGTGAAQQVLEGAVAQFPSAVTPDGTALVFRKETPPASLGDPPGMDLFLVPFDGDHRARPLVATPFDELNGEVSPDGHWLAYQSNESGRHEIYVRPFPGTDTGKWQVSTNGGMQPLWARNGRELFYQTMEALMSVPLKADSAFEAGIPIKVAGVPALTAVGAAAGVTNPPGRMYDVSPDGRRFLMIKETRAASEPASSARMVFVQNWFEELTRRVPAR